MATMTIFTWDTMVLHIIATIGGLILTIMYIPDMFTTGDRILIMVQDLQEEVRMYIALQEEER
jgi:hypothetical protein